MQQKNIFDRKQFTDHLNQWDNQSINKLIEASKNPIFQPQYNLSYQQQKQLNQERVKLIGKSQAIKIEEILKNPNQLISSHEIISEIDYCLATIFHTHYVLFGGSIMNLGTKQHEYLFPQINNLDIFGCFAFNELGHGQNSLQLETIAKFQKRSKTFIIHSPTLVSQKYFIVNASNGGNMALVFAQLFNEGNSKSEGIHAFLVPLRDMKLGNIIDGIHIEETGAKFGLNGMDSACLSFTNIQLPISSLLDKHTKYDSNLNQIIDLDNSKYKTYKRNLEVMVFARFCLTSMLLGRSKQALLVAQRYAQQRKCDSYVGKDNESVLLINTLIYQSQVYPLLAKTICLNLAFNEAKQQYCDCLSKNIKIPSQFLLINFALKISASYYAKEIGLTLTERLGGQGFLSVNRVSELIPIAHENINRSGENILLMQKIARELFMSIRMKKFIPPKLTINLKTLIHLNYIKSIDTLLDLLKLKQIVIAKKLTSLTKLYLQSKGSTLYKEWSKNISQLVQDASQSYINLQLAQLSLDNIQKIADPILKDQVKTIYRVFLLTLIINDLGWYLVSKKINLKACQNLQSDLKYYIKQLRVKGFDIDTVESFGVPEHLISEPIAKSNYSQVHDTFIKKYDPFLLKPNL